MSRKQFVRFRDQGFWAFDVSLAIFLKHLIDAANRQLAREDAPWLRKAVDWWRVVAAINDYGFDVEGSWSTDQVQVFIELANEAVVDIRSRQAFAADEVKSWCLLDGFPLETRGEAVVETGPIVVLGEAIVSLIDGSLVFPPPNTYWYFGTANHPDTIGRRKPGE